MGYLSAHCLNIALLQVPISPATDAQKAPIIERTRAILADPDSPAAPSLEAEINHLVYNLYGLTDKDIVIIEGKSTKARQ